MNMGFARTLLVLSAMMLGLAAGPALAKDCTVDTCCQNSTQCTRNAGYCCNTSPLPRACVGTIRCQSGQPASADPTLTYRPGGNPVAAFFGPLAADARSLAPADPLGLHGPLAQAD